jgi:hypothetical protein
MQIVPQVVHVLVSLQKEMQKKKMIHLLNVHLQDQEEEAVYQKEKEQQICLMG